MNYMICAGVVFGLAVAPALADQRTPDGVAAVQACVAAMDDTGASIADCPAQAFVLCDAAQDDRATFDCIVATGAYLQDRADHWLAVLPEKAPGESSFQTFTYERRLSALRQTKRQADCGLIPRDPRILAQENGPQIMCDVFEAANDWIIARNLARRAGLLETAGSGQ